MAVAENASAHHKELRKSELGRYSNELLQQVVERRDVPVTPLAGGERYSMIVAIVEWEISREEVVLELSKKVDDLSERAEVIALRNLSLMMMEIGDLQARQRDLLTAAYIPSYNALVEKLQGEGFSRREINAAVHKRALTWG